MSHWSRQLQRRNITAKRRILLVEPDAANRDSLLLLLEGRGYDVSVATTAAGAVAMATSHGPEIVLLELALPDMDDQATITAIKRVSSRPFVVAYTGFHLRQAAARAAGCDAVILKPSVDLLLTVVEALRPRRAAVGGTLQ